MEFIDSIMGHSDLQTQQAPGRGAIPCFVYCMETRMEMHIQKLLESEIIYTASITNWMLSHNKTQSKMILHENLWKLNERNVCA